MMDATTRANSALNSHSEWERLGYMNYPNLRPNNLTREISPVFQYTDELNKEKWTGLSRSEYQLIEPVCRLASAMIESPASLAFLHALMYSPRTEIISLSQRAGYPCFKFNRSETLLIPDSEDPRLALKRLVPNLNWVLVDSEEIEGCFGRTVKNWVGCSIVDNGRNGFQSTIKLQKDLVKALSELSQKADKTIQILSQQFFLATLLCHEVVHSFNGAVDPALVNAHRIDSARRAIRARPPCWLKYCEPFYEDQAQTELGHCWENEVFGGSTRYTTCVDTPFLICKWPNYKPSRTGPSPPPPRRAGHKATQTLYIIPAHFIHSIQQQAFWDRLDPVDALSLRVQKMSGFRTSLPPGPWKDVDWESSMSSEGDWPADEQTWVYRNEDPDVVAKLYSTANHAATTKWVLDLPDPAPETVNTN